MEHWAGELGPLLELPGVTDVLVHQPGEAWVDCGTGLRRVRIGPSTPDAVRAMAVRFALAGGARLDDASPVVDARLPDGTRLHAALPPIAVGCAAISLRTVREQALSLDDLVASAMVHADLVPLLEALVAHRVSIVVSGATGSGKTTLLASLLSLVPHDQRLVIIEEAGELTPTHPHVVRLVERKPNIEGAGAMALDRLVRESLRMRPDRLVLGECRGGEIKDVLAAFNTGHRGGLTTIHANSVRDVPARLTALGAMAGMPARAVDLQAAAAFDVLIAVTRHGPLRAVDEIAVLEVRRSLTVVPAVSVTAQGVQRHDGWQRLSRLVNGQWP